MVLGARLPKVLWGEAINTVVYLINRSPSFGMKSKTPMKVQSGKLVDYSKLKVFGILAYAYVKKDKLEATVEKGVILGYAKGVKGYILQRLDPKPYKLIISRDVIFGEARIVMHTLNQESEKEKTQFKVETLIDKSQQDLDNDPESSSSDTDHLVSNPRN